MFPPLIGRTARVSSRCAATGVPVSLTVAPDAVRDVEPAGAAVSLAALQPETGLRQAFCCHVHFFADPRVANGWAAERQDVEIVSVQAAFDLGRDLARHLNQANRPVRSGAGLKAAPTVPQTELVRQPEASS